MKTHFFIDVINLIYLVGWGQDVHEILRYLIYKLKTIFRLYIDTFNFDMPIV